MSDRPLSDAERQKLRLIIGDAPDNVVRMNAWCKRTGGTIAFDTKGVYTARQGDEVLATARDLGVLMTRLEHPEP